MNHFELVEKLVNTFGVSYECAKNALEASNWDLTEAAILVEREKNGVKAEAPAANSAPKCSKNNRPRCEKPEMPKFVKDIWAFLSKNAVVIKKNSDEIFLDIPFWLAILLVCCFFWAVIILLVILLIMGYRVSLRGPKGEKLSVKWSAEKDDAVEAVKDSIDKIKETAETLKADAAEAKAEAEAIIEAAEPAAENAPESTEEKTEPQE